MEAGKVILQRDGAVARIVFDNEARRNAMSLAMWQQLGEHVAAIGSDIRCVVLQGAGTKAFVAGADISEFGSNRRSPDDVAFYDRCSDDAMEALHGLAVPTIAMISGFCIGGGMALALCCDVRIAGNDSQFAIPAGRLGLGYPVSGIQRLLDAVSVPAATDMMVSARRYSAVEAQQMGLVNRIYDADRLTGEVDDYAASVVRNAPMTLRAAKTTIRTLARGGDAAAIAACDKLISACFASDDYLEGMTAFTEKREPQFKGH